MLQFLCYCKSNYNICHFISKINMQFLKLIFYIQMIVILGQIVLYYLFMPNKFYCIILLIIKIYLYPNNVFSCYTKKACLKYILSVPFG